MSTRLRRKREKEERIEAKNVENQSEAPKTPLLVSKSLWNHMSPSSRRKVKGRISNAGTPAGLNSLFRREVGVNLSNAINEPKQEETKLQLEIKNFFLRDDISRTCPDTKRMKVNPEDKEEKVPVIYWLGTLHCLHDKFLAESITGCSLEYFRTNCPFYVIKPKANDWGTCLCDICLNPELKLEALAKTIGDNDLKWGDNKGYKDIDSLIGKLKCEKSVSYNEWQMVTNEKSKKGSKTSRKVPLVKKFSIIVSIVKKDLLRLKEHLIRVHAQYKALKLAKEEAIENPEVCTIQIDWSENCAMRQSREEKSAFYHEDFISIHAVRVWSKEEMYSWASLSDATDHTASAVITSIEPLLENFVETGKKKVNIVSDSPTSQYRNKKVFWLVKMNKSINIKWVYLE